MSAVINLQPYTSPCGELLLGAYNRRLCLCDWLMEKHHERIMKRLHRSLRAKGIRATDPVLDEAARQLDEYFAGKLREFGIPLLPVGTDFQKHVWQALRAIPYGTTISYADLARRLNMPKAVRAVANANGANAISIFVPCHRVVGADGSLTGYAGGLDTKQWLLTFETDIY